MKLPTMDDNTPNTGLVLFTDADGIEREIDFIDAPLGLNHRDVRDTAVQLMLPDENGEPSMPMLVMHPERCMESRIVNAIELRKTQPLALRQLEVSVICARLWSQVILDSEDLPEDERVRAVLRIKRAHLPKCVDDRRFRAVVLDRRRPVRRRLGRRPAAASPAAPAALPADARAARRPNRARPTQPPAPAPRRAESMTVSSRTRPPARSCHAFRGAPANPGPVPHVLRLVRRARA